METMETKTGNETWMGLVKQNMTRAAMMLVMMVMTLTAGAAGSPWSHLDVCEGGGGYIHIMGWTYDPDSSYPSLNVNIYVYTDEDCTTPYGEMHLVKADEPRPDKFTFGSGDHGFDTYIAAEPGTYYVKIIAIDKTDDENALINSPFTEVTVTEPQPITVSLTSETIGVMLHDGDVLTGTSGTHCKVKIADGATVTLRDVDLSAIPNDYEHNWPGINCLGDATIILEGDNVVYGGSQRPGIHWPGGKTLTIKGDGSLTALGGQGAPGIGSGYNLSCGHLRIEGGSITARGDRNIDDRGGAGLGSTSESSCGTITITGGTVTAIGGWRSAGIGAGNYNSSCGDITISGGIVTATGCEKAAGIGGGSSAPNITITEDVTSVTATAGANAPHSIGAGMSAISGNGIGSCGTVTIGDAVIGNLTQNTAIYIPADEAIVNEPFRTNGGTGGSMAGKNLYRYRAQTIPECGFTREHYDFCGWNTESDGSGTNYPVGQYVLNISDVTLYAQWTLHNYRITYNLDGGTNPSSNPATYTIESSDITLAYPVRFGYDFVGWTYEGQNDPIMDVTIPTGSAGAETYTAHWTPSSIATLIPEFGYGVLYDGYTLTGTGGPDTHVTIADGATVTLSNVTITDIPNDNNHRWAGITCLGNATIILADGTTNNVKGGDSFHPGIFVPENKTLTIKGTGTLNASSNGSAAGIGGGRFINCGHIVVEGGNVNATGGNYAAGIGCGYDASCGDIVINGGTVTATGGSYSVGIGAGSNSSCGNITISGGTVNATGGFKAAGIGCGDNASCGNITISNSVSSVTASAGEYAPYSIGAGRGQCTVGVVTIGGKETGSIPQSPFTYRPNEPTDRYTVTFNANGGTEGTMEPQVFTTNTAEALNRCLFTRDGYEFVGWNTAPNGSGDSYADGQDVINLGNTTLYAQWKLPGDVTLTTDTKEVTLYDDQALTGTGGPDTHVTIADGATVTLSNVTITDIPNDNNHRWAGITCLGNATIILADGTTNNVKGGDSFHPGIFVPENKTLTIKGTGTLNASSNGSAAGIGGGRFINCGHIVVEGGNVNATGGNYAAGIGCGYDASCGDIVINGGTVTATGGSYSVGIGAGSNSSCGNITISGGTVNATGGFKAAGIGSGSDASCEDITITGGTVNATGGFNAAGIGSGSDASCEDITITGCTVTATCGNEAVPIGSGYNGSCGTVTIGDGLIDEISGTTRTLIPRIYDLWVNGKQVNACTGLDILGDGTATFDSETSTLTLDHPAQNLTIRSEDIDLTLKGYYKMDTSSDEVALDVSGGTLTLDGDFTFRSKKAGIRVTNNMNVKGRLQAFGGMDGGICYAGTETGKGMTLERGFFGKTKVELKGTTQTVTHPEGNFYAIWPRSEVTVEIPAGGNIQEYTSHINDGQSIATYAVVSLPGTASGDGSAAHPFEIGNGEHWAKACADVANGCETEGLHFQLIGGFTATEMMGTVEHPFAGIITGDLNYFNVIADINATKGVAALFPYVSGATIRDLIVKGSISGGAGSAGIVGQAVGGTTTLSRIVFDGTVTAADGAAAEDVIVGAKADGTTVAITNSLDLPHHIWAESNTPAYRLYGSGMSLLLTSNTGLMYDGGIWAPEGSTIEFTVIGNMGNVVATEGTLTSLGGYNYSIEMPANNVGIVEANAHPFEFACVNNGEMENGSIRTNRGISGEVVAGTPIYVVAVPDDYCLLEKITVMTVDGNEEIAVDEDHFFSMPASDVTISATFKKKYSFENGHLQLLCGDFNNSAKGSWDPGEVTPSSVTKVTAAEGVRFTQSVSALFSGFSNCTEMDLSGVETSAMTITAMMFYGCENLKTLNMMGWNTANVTDMSNMFDGCGPTGKLELDLSGFNISAVSNFSRMFENCGVYKLTLPAGMAVTTDMELKNGKRYQEGGSWKRSGWIILDSDGTVVSGPESETYAAIAAPPIPMTFVWQWMPDDFVLELPDNQDNRELIRTWHGAKLNVKLTDRVLYKDGDWNTLCVPFEVPFSTMKSALSVSVDDENVHELDTESWYDDSGSAYDDQYDPSFQQTGFDESTGVLRLYFDYSGELKAGKPYIIRWPKPDGYVAYDGTNAGACSDIVSPVFSGVTIDKTMNPVVSHDGKVTFTGQYSTIVAGEDYRYIALGSGNTLGYVSKNGTLRPFRAHFEVTSGQNVKGYRISFGEENPSIIHSSQFIIHNNDDAWYSIDGIKLQGKPTRKGIYIHNGRRIVVK